MGEVISIISGKGGTGKTALCAAVATCLAVDGNRVLCIDGDIGLRNLDLALGLSDRMVISFTDVIEGRYRLDDATTHPAFPNLALLTAPVGERDVVTREGFESLIEKAKEAFDYCLIDAPAGVGDVFRLVSAPADRFVVVATPDPASLRDAAQTAERMYLDGRESLSLVVNRVHTKLFSRMSLTVDDIMDEVGLPLLGIVPEDPNVMLAAAAGEPLILYSGRGAAEAALRISRRLRGEMMPLMKLK